jgi:hypothetical protein
MVRNLFMTCALIVGALIVGVVSTGSGIISGAMAWGSEFTGPGPGVTGNSTGGIFPYSPGVEPIYHQIADDHCARWGRFAKVTSIHRVYGDYVGFVCYDRLGKTH